MLKYSEYMEELLKENRDRIKYLERSRNLFPLANEICSVIENHSTPFIDWEGINTNFWGIKKKDALDLLDSVFWQKGLNTTDPIIEDGTIMVRYYGPPVPGNGARPAIVMTFGLAVGQGCYKVPVGHETVTKYEWKCT